MLRNGEDDLFLVKMSKKAMIMCLGRFRSLTIAHSTTACYDLFTHLVERFQPVMNREPNEISLINLRWKSMIVICKT